MKAMHLSLGLAAFVLFLVPSSVRAQAAAGQFIHNSPDPGMALVDVYINNGATVFLDNFAFREASTVLPLPSGGVDIGFAPSTSSGPGDVFTTVSVLLNPGDTYVLMVTGAFDSGLPSNPEGVSTSLGVEVLQPFTSTAPAGRTEILAYHGIPDLRSVDIWILDGEVIFGDLQFRDFEGYVNLPAEDYVILLTRVGDPTVQFEAYFADLSGLDGGAAVLFLSGYGTDNPSLPDVRVLLAEPDGTVTELDIASVPSTADVQVIHNSPDPALATMDIYINNVLDFELNDIAFLDATGPMALSSGDVTIGFALANSSGPGDIFSTETVQFIPGFSYVVMVTGVEDGGLPANPDGVSTALGVEVFQPLQSIAPNGQVGILAFNGTPDAPRVDIRAQGVGIYFEDVQYRELSGYSNVPEANNILTITLTGEAAEILGAFDGTLDGLGGFSGVLYTSGYLADDPSLPSLGLNLAMFTGFVLNFEATVITVEPVSWGKLKTLYLN